MEKLMPQNTHIASFTADTNALPEPDHASQDPLLLQQKASALAQSFAWLPNSPSSDSFTQLSAKLARDFFIADPSDS